MEDGTWRGIRIRSQALELRCLFFTDNSLLFLQANADGVNSLKKVLDAYQAATGQSINMAKSSVFYNKVLRGCQRGGY